MCSRISPRTKLANTGEHIVDVPVPPPRGGDRTRAGAQGLLSEDSGGGDPARGIVQGGLTASQHKVRLRSVPLWTRILQGSTHSGDEAPVHGVTPIVKKQSSLPPVTTP